MRMIVQGIVLLVLAGMAWVRFAPTDPAAWHQPVPYAEDADFAGGAVRVLVADKDRFETAASVLSGLPRTRALAGNVSDNHITFVTRSRVFGFPDYTTLEFSDGTLKAWARLRFGHSDLGVNRDRLEKVLGRSDL